MFRRLSTKWLLAVLASVVVPFVGFAWYVDVKLADRLSNDIVRYYLLRFAADMGDRIDDELDERRLDVELLASDPLVLASARGEGPALPSMLETSLARILDLSHGFDLLVVVQPDGRSVAAGVSGEGREELIKELYAADFRDATWFQEALAGRPVLVDQHISPYLLGRDLDLADPTRYGVGIAQTIRDPEMGEPIGVVYAVLNWRVFQVDLLDDYRKGRTFEGIGSEIYSSSYSWLWKSDANTIIGHPRTELYGRLVEEPPVSLPQLVQAAKTSEWGMFPEYEFNEQLKQAAYKHCKSEAAGGLGWIVGIGIDNTDIYATVTELNRALVKATLFALLVVVSWTMFIARRTTRPLLNLREHTRQVAAGNLDARIEVQSTDELGELAQDFNIMTLELAANRERLVQAEKESAWREMARQVAHEIKNPLTPISLSASLLRRARDESSPEFDAIFDRTIDLIQRQVENLRQIVQDFYAFAGARQLEPRSTDLRPLVQEVLELNAAWAQELGVQVAVLGNVQEAHLDPTELRRVLINLISNSLEAMPSGGHLKIHLAEQGDQILIEILDSGSGLTEEVRERLFEPYFTTRSHGTGLGLAICKRVIDEMGGDLSLQPAPADSGSGTLAQIRLPKGNPL